MDEKTTLDGCPLCPVCPHRLWYVARIKEKQAEMEAEAIALAKRAGELIGEILDG